MNGSDETQFEVLSRQMATSDTHRRLALGPKLMDYLTMHDQPISETDDVGLAIDFTLTWISSSNFKVSSYGLDILELIVVELGPKFRPYVQTCLEPIIDRLGDAKETVRDKAIVLMYRLTEVVYSDPNSFFEKATPLGLAHKNCRVKVETLHLLQTALRRYGAQKFLVARYMTAIVGLLSDQSAAVREAAMQTLTLFYILIGERIRHDVERKFRIPPTKLVTLLAMFDAASASKLTSNRNSLSLSAKSEVDSVLTSVARMSLTNNGTRHGSDSIDQVDDASLCIRSNSTLSAEALPLKMDRGHLVKGRFDDHDVSSSQRGSVVDVSVAFSDDLSDAGSARGSTHSGSVRKIDPTDRSRVAYPGKQYQQSKKSASRSLSTASYSGTPVAGTVDADAFMTIFDSVKPAHVYGSKSLSDEFVKIKTTLSAASTEWRAKVESLATLKSLVLTAVQGGTLVDAVLLPHLKAMETTFQPLVKDLRSQVVKDTCITLAFIAKHLGLKADRFLESQLVNLIAQIANSARVMATSASMCLHFIVRYCQSGRFIPTLCSHTNPQIQKNKEIRRHCCQLIDALLHLWPRAKSTSVHDKYGTVLADAIRRGVMDADAEARRASRSAFRGYSDFFGSGHAERLFASLDANQRRLIESEASDQTTSWGTGQNRTESTRHTASSKSGSLASGICSLSNSSSSSSLNAGHGGLVMSTLPPMHGVHSISAGRRSRQSSVDSNASSVSGVGYNPNVTMRSQSRRTATTNSRRPSGIPVVTSLSPINGRYLPCGGNSGSRMSTSIHTNNLTPSPVNGAAHGRRMSGHGVTVISSPSSLNNTLRSNSAIDPSAARRASVRLQYANRNRLMASANAAHSPGRNNTTLSRRPSLISSPSPIMQVSRQRGRPDFSTSLSGSASKTSPSISAESEFAAPPVARNTHSRLTSQPTSRSTSPSVNRDQFGRNWKSVHRSHDDRHYTLSCLDNSEDYSIMDNFLSTSYGDTTADFLENLPPTRPLLRANGSSQAAERYNGSKSETLAGVHQSLSSTASAIVSYCETDDHGDVGNGHDVGDGDVDDKARDSNLLDKIAVALSAQRRPVCVPSRTNLISQSDCLSPCTMSFLSGSDSISLSRSSSDGKPKRVAVFNKLTKMARCPDEEGGDWRWLDDNFRLILSMLMTEEAALAASIGKMKANSTPLSKDETSVVAKLVADRARIFAVVHELVKLNHLAPKFLDFAELVILRTLEAQQLVDQQQEVCWSAETCSTALAENLPPHVIARVLVPLINHADQEPNSVDHEPKMDTSPSKDDDGHRPLKAAGHLLRQAAIKMMNRLIDALAKRNQRGVPDLAPDIEPVISALLTSYESVHSTVRKASVFCIVALYCLLKRDGNDDHILDPYLARLHGSKLKLLNVYIKRAEDNNDKDVVSKTN